MNTDVLLSRLRAQLGNSNRNVAANSCWKRQQQADMALSQLLLRVIVTSGILQCLHNAA